jgi:hypothetical protein
MDRIRLLSERERRSTNSQILVLLERALAEQSEDALAGAGRVSVQAQASLWERLCGRWEDDRSGEQIAAEIMDQRTPGREVAL